MPAALPFATLMLISASASGTTTPPTQMPGTAEAFSVVAGRALGAAAACDQIAGARIDRDAGMFGDTIERLARNSAERNAANRALQRAVGEGGAAIDHGTTDCAAAEAALGQAERQAAR